MTVKDYLEIHTSKDIESMGIYSTIKIKDACGRDTNIIDTNVQPVDLVKYLDREIDHVSLGIFDEKRKTIAGDDYDAKFIRACIYVR